MVIDRREIGLHCSFLEHAGAWRIPCVAAATVSWWNPSGWRVGACAEHADAIVVEGKRRSWEYGGPVAALERAA